MHLLPSSGYVTYDPFRGDMKNTGNWCVINCDKEITRYYRWWLQKEKHIILNQPSWDAHISVVRGERILPKFQHKWKHLQRMRIKFDYEHGDLQVSKDRDQPGHFYWIRVKCDTVDQIREELGLVASWKYHHLTIGRTHY